MANRKRFFRLVYVYGKCLKFQRIIKKQNSNIISEIWIFQKDQKTNNPWVIENFLKNICSYFSAKVEHVFILEDEETSEKISIHNNIEILTRVFFTIILNNKKSSMFPFLFEEGFEKDYLLDNSGNLLKDCSVILEKRLENFSKKSFLQKMFSFFDS